MTYSDFLSLVQEHAKQGGTSFLQSSNTSGYLSLINRGLKGFTRYTYSTIAKDQTFTSTSGTATYDISPMFEPLKLSLGGNFLRNLDGKYGPESFYNVTSYDLTTTGTTSLWCVSGDQEITIYPSSSSTGYLVGYCEHLTITASGTVDLPDYIIDVAALWVSTLTRFPHIQGSDLFEQILAIDQFAARKLDGFRASNRQRLSSPVRRRSYQESYFI